jgi:CheY-like chemotaxis protein
LDLRIVPSRLWIKSDRRLLPRLMQNLVSNAIKYTPRGKVLIGVRRRAGFVRLQVLDTGPGIAPDQQQIIFKEFQRVQATAASVHGLGLGLSIVERISKVLNHRVHVASEVGRGSAFSVTLPQTAAGLAKPALPTAAEIVSARLSGLTVLCIDNDATILEGMRTLLTGWNCRVITADGSLRARAEVAGARPDIILADYHLDAETGMDAIAAVREATGVAVPALIITADNSAEVQRIIREAGYGLLRKPVKIAALRAALTQISARAEAAAAE